MLAGKKIDGLEVAKSVKERVKKAVDELKSQGVQPCLATILIGNNPASATYVKNKHKACEEVGILTKDHAPSDSVSQNEINSLIDSLNNDSSVHGILMQLPLPEQLDEFATLSRIFPIKDVDGLTPHNVGLLSMEKAILKACTPSGIMEMFDYYKIELQGKNAVMIRWNIGDIRFDKPSYSIDQTANIQVFDPDMNLNPEGIDQIEIQVSSVADVAGIIINAAETTEESGLFVGTISFTQSQTSSGNRLFAAPGNSLLAKYDDYTLPDPYSKSDNLEITSSSEFLSNIPPTDRVFIEKNFLTNSLGELISNPSTDEQLQIVGKVLNNQNYVQPFVFIIQIKDSNGTIISLSWIKGELSPNQDLEVSQSWNPIRTGNYTVESFVWSSLSDTIPLSPTLIQTYDIE